MRKYYFFDCGQVEGDEGSKLENLVALSILREIDFLRDTQGRKLSLHYVRDKEGNEIDFVVVEKGTVKVIVEVKWQDDRPAKAFLRFQTLKPERAYQIVGKLNRERAIGDSLQIISAGPWLHGLQL